MPDQALVEVNDLDACYGDFQALFGVSLRVEAGQAVAIIGANGAGKKEAHCSRASRACSLRAPTRCD